MHHIKNHSLFLIETSYTPCNFISSGISGIKLAEYKFALLFCGSSVSVAFLLYDALTVSSFSIWPYTSWLSTNLALTFS